MLAAPALASCGTQPNRAPPAAAEPPSFIVIMSDDQDAASLATMPVVGSRVAARGARLDHYYVTTSECCPSRASMLTGKYAHNHGVLGNDPPIGGFGAFDDSDTIATRMQSAGWNTAYIGKYLNGYGWPALGNDPNYVPPGWSTWTAPVEHSEYRMYDYTLNHNGELEDHGDHPADHQTTVLGRNALSYLRSVPAGEPFMLILAPSAPHVETTLPPEAERNPRPVPGDEGSREGDALPLPPSVPGDLGPEVHDQLETLYRSRLESLEGIDRWTGRLLSELRRSGRLASTYVAYTSDNGFLLGQHGQRGKKVVYEESVRVPFAIRGPGIAAGSELGSLAANIDLAPTIADLAGVNFPGADGISLRKALTGSETTPTPERDALLLEQLDDRTFAAVHTLGQLYAELEPDRIRFHDMSSDPFQITNLAGDPSWADREAQLRRLLERLRDCAGALDCSAALDAPQES